jgi:hypothetical protein
MSLVLCRESFKNGHNSEDFEEREKKHRFGILKFSAIFMLVE